MGNDNNSKGLLDNILERFYQTSRYVHTAYIAFILALIFALVSGSDNITNKTLIVCLLFCSLPSLLTFMSLDYIVAIEQKRPGSFSRGVSRILGYVPSIVGIILLIGSYSWIASIIFVLLTVTWMFTIPYVLKKGCSPNSQI